MERENDFSEGLGMPGFCRGEHGSGSERGHVGHVCDHGTVCPEHGSHHGDGPAAHAHEHHHHDERVLIDGEQVFLSLFEHEGALVASYRFSLRGDLASARERMTGFVRRIGDAVTQQGGIIGHIKAFARARGDSFRISLVADDPDVVCYAGEDVLVEGVAIVMLVDEDRFAQLMEREVEGLVR